MIQQVTQPAGSVRADELYTIDEVKRRLAMRDTSWRTLLRTGLPLRKIGKRKFVLGRELIDHIAAIDQPAATRI